MRWAKAYAALAFLAPRFMPFLPPRLASTLKDEAVEVGDMVVADAEVEITSMGEAKNAALTSAEMIFFMVNSLRKSKQSCMGIA
jgi:hypothetical protein